MSKPSLRVVDPNKEHPRDTARRLIKERQEYKEPKTNIHASEGYPAPTLVVDEVLKRSQPNLIGRK